MHAWRSLSRCISQTGHIRAPTYKSLLVACRCHYSTTQDSSRPSSGRAGVDASQGPVQKDVPLSETLRKLNSKGAPDTAVAGHRRGDYASFRKPPLPASSKFKKSKPRLKPEREKRQRSKEKKATKKAIRKSKEKADIDHLNKSPVRDRSSTRGDLLSKEEIPPPDFPTENWSQESWKGVSHLSCFIS